MHPFKITMFRYFRISVFVTFITILGICSVSAQTTHPSVEQVYNTIKSMESQQLDHWQFDAVERNQGTTYRMTFLPIQNGTGDIELHDINGEKPSLKEEESFHKDHHPRKPKEIEKVGVELSEIISPNSLAYQSTQDGISTFTFAPQFKFGDEISDAYPLEGVLLYQDTSGFISDFYVHTQAPFSPKFGMKVINFDLHLQFTKHQSGMVLAKKIHTQFEGKAFFFATIKQDIEVSYFNYQAPAIDAH